MLRINFLFVISNNFYKYFSKINYPPVLNIYMYTILFQSFALFYNMNLVVDDKIIFVIIVCTKETKIISVRTSKIYCL